MLVNICQTVCFVRFCSVYRDFYEVRFPCLPCITPVVYIQYHFGITHSKGNKIHNVINCNYIWPPLHKYTAMLYKLPPICTRKCYNLIYGISYTTNTVIFDMLPLIHKRTQQSKRWKSCSFQALPGKQTNNPKNSATFNILVHVLRKSSIQLDHISCYWNNHYISFLLRYKDRQTD